MLPVIKKNVDLAATLLFTEGESIPHPVELEEEAYSLAKELGGQVPILKHVLLLCGEPQTPRQRYIAEKAYAWLGEGYNEELIRCAQKYLQGAPWSELPTSTVVENGITIHNGSACRASILLDIAVALQEEGDMETALSYYIAAYRLEPYNVLNAIKASDVIAKQRNKSEALHFLLAQRNSAYFTPAKYKDSAGNMRYNDTFKQLLNAHVLKMENA